MYIGSQGKNEFGINKEKRKFKLRKRGRENKKIEREVKIVYI